MLTPSTERTEQTLLSKHMFTLTFWELSEKQKGGSAVSPNAEITHTEKWDILQEKEYWAASSQSSQD